MLPSRQYQLIDFGGGRRLERFGTVVLDRPCPAVEQIERADAQAWQRADARFERTGRDEGQWSLARELPPRWTVEHGSVTFELKLSPAGHVGVFPEQADNWDWVAGRLREGRPCLAGQGAASPSSTNPKVLNLFAYTGGSTLAAAATGAEVVHVDAARNTIARARRNAELSGMGGRPVRWIAEDAMRFVKREARRGNRYDAVMLDPPSYGHGPRGEVWRLSRDLPQLLRLCSRLTAPRRRFMLLTCHTPSFDPARLKQMMTEALGRTDDGRLTAGPLTIRSATGRELPCGVVARWQTHGLDPSQ